MHVDGIKVKCYMTVNEQSERDKTMNRKCHDCHAQEDDFTMLALADDNSGDLICQDCNSAREREYIAQNPGALHSLDTLCPAAGGRDW